VDTPLTVQAQVETARSLLMQKGNVIKLQITVPHTQANWIALAPYLGGYVDLTLAKLSDEDYQAKINNQKSLDFGDVDDER